MEDFAYLYHHLLQRNVSFVTPADMYWHSSRFHKSVPDLKGEAIEITWQRHWRRKFIISVQREGVLGCGFFKSIFHQGVRKQASQASLYLNCLISTLLWKGNILYLFSTPVLHSSWDTYKHVSWLLWKYVSIFIYSVCVFVIHTRDFFVVVAGRQIAAETTSISLIPLQSNQQVYWFLV